MSLYQHVSQFPSASVELYALETYHGNDFWSTGAACTSCARATDAHAQAIDSQPCALHYSQPTWLLLRATPPEKWKQTQNKKGQKLRFLSCVLSLGSDQVTNDDIWDDFLNCVLAVYGIPFNSGTH